MIDLHLHTTASDGRCTPLELVRRAGAAGIIVLSVTDHDTMAASAEAAHHATELGIEAVPGIEITAVSSGLDVHVLGYFLDAAAPGLVALLEEQRRDRVRRVTEMVDRLSTLGVSIEPSAVLRATRDVPRGSVGRPHVARALVEAGHVASVAEAFATLIGTQGPAYVERRGVAPAVVVGVIAEAGGVASLAHPGLLRRDDLIPDLAGAGLGALEARHSQHPPHTEDHYLRLAMDHDLAVTGGADYHGDDSPRSSLLGRVGPTPEEFARFRDRRPRGTSF